MSLPSNLSTIILTGDYGDITGGSDGGWIRIEPNVPVLTDAIGNKILIGGYIATLDDNGKISVTLPRTDDTALSPTGWKYRITERFKNRINRAPYLIDLLISDGPTKDLADVVHLTSEPPVYSTVYGVLTRVNTWTAANTFTDLIVTGALTLDGVNIASPPGGTVKYLRADGAWTIPPGTSTGAVSSVNGQTGDIVVSASSIAAVPETVVDAKGDILVASDADVVTKLPVGANGKLLAADDTKTTGLNWIDPPAVSDPPFRLITRTFNFAAGGITFPDHSAGFQVLPYVQGSIPAAVGHYVKMYLSGMWEHVGSDFIEFVVIGAGDTILRYSSTRTSTPSLEGDPEEYPNPGFPKFHAPFAFHAEASDIVGGNIKFGIASKGAGGSVLYSYPAYPMNMDLENHGPTD